MNRASPRMLHCLNDPEIFADTTVLERQNSRLKRHYDQLPHHHLRKYSTYSLPASIPAAQVPNSLTSGGETELSEVQRDMGLENVWSGLSKIGIPTAGFGSGLELNPPISRTYSSPPVITEVKNREPVLSEKLNPPVGRESFKKRKTNTKIVNEEDTKEKRIKVCVEERDSKVPDQIPTKNNSTATTAIRETSADTSKENSKVSEVQKPDYIHVRARRGQATDSHSLAERARREKISERMKYLQDLVPGCNKITGKAGMLDEIINYVQSLQRQVEFLSMKLAAVNPRLDFNLNVDEIFPKEAHPTPASKFPPLGIQSELDSPVYLHFDQSQQMGSFCGQEMISDGLRRAISAPVSIPENYLVPTCFPPSSAWDVDFQSLYNVGFDQGRTEPFPSQPYTGSIELNNLKMEM